MQPAKAFILAPYLLALLLLIPQPAPAQPKPIVFAAPKAGWPPFIIVSGTPPRATGIMPDVFRAACARAGYAADFQFFPEKRAQMLLAQGLVDAYPKSPEWMDEPSDYLWSDPVQEVGDIIVYRRAEPVRLSSIKDLIGKSIGTMHGYVYPTLDRLIESGAIRTYTATCTKHLLLMLARKHVDGIVTPRHVAEWIIRNDPELDSAVFAFSEKPVDSAPYGFAFVRGKGWEPFIETLNHELAAMRRDGRLKAILNKYR